MNVSSKPVPRPGFTLVEFLLYIAIVAGVLLAISFIAFNIVRGRWRLQAFEELSQNARSGIARVELAIHNATAVTTPTFGTTSTVLVLQTANTSTNPTLIAVSNGMLQMKEGSSATTSLMADEVRANSVLFYNLSTTSSLASIRIELAVSSTVAGAATGTSLGQFFYGSANIRRRL